MAEYSRRGFLRNAFTLASGLAVASVIPSVNPLERIALAGDSDGVIKFISVGASKEEIQKAIDRINFYREQAFRHYVDVEKPEIKTEQELRDYLGNDFLDESVIKVEEDPELTDAANKHAVYLILNYPGRSLHSSEAAKLKEWHSEDPNLPGYTKEGAIAARSPIGPQDKPEKTVTDHIATFYHRLRYIDPKRKRFGIGFAEGNNNRVSVISSVIEGHSLDLPILYPAPNQENVPFSWDGREIPNPIPEEGRGQLVGYPITATFFISPRSSFKGGIEATLKDEKGLEVPCYFSSWEKPANPLRPDNSNSICLIPKFPLGTNRQYTVFMSADINLPYTEISVPERYRHLVSGRYFISRRSKKMKWKQEWSFKTGSK